MSDDASIATASAVVESLENTLADFERHCDQWEQELETLFCQLESIDIDDFASRLLSASQRNVRQLADEIRLENGNLLERQDKIAEDLTDLRNLLEQSSLQSTSAVPDS